MRGTPRSPQSQRGARETAKTGCQCPAKAGLPAPVTAALLAKRSHDIGADSCGPLTELVASLSGELELGHGFGHVGEPLLRRPARAFRQPKGFPKCLPEL